MHEYKSPEKEFSIKNYIVPLTTAKAITWIIIVGFVVFGNMLSNSFVWDDVTYIFGNAEVHTVNIPLFFQTSLFNNSGQYRPLTELYFAFLYSFLSTTPFFYHLLQLIIHICNTVFVFILFKRFFKIALSFLLALIFLIHPIQVESVSYISSTDSVLLFFFGMSAFLSVFDKKQTLYKNIVVFLCLLASVLIKEAGALFIIFCLLYTYLFFKKIFVRQLVISASVIFSYFVIRFAIGNVFFQSRPLIPIDRITLYQRFLTFPEIIFYYIKTFLFPLELVINQQWVVTSLSVENFYLPFFVLVIICCVVIWFYWSFLKGKKNEDTIFIFFATWTLVGFGLYSQLVPLDFTVADRWMYVPLVGLLGLIGSIVSNLTINKKYVPTITTVSLIIIFLFAVRTIVRNTDWTNPLILYAHDTRYYTNYLTENDYAQYLFISGDSEDALFHERNSVSEFPYEQNTLNLANIYYYRQDFTQAGYYYNLALHDKTYIDWTHTHVINTYIDFAKLLLLEGNYAKAENISSLGLSDYANSPYRVYLFFLSAIADYNMHDTKEAKNAANQALYIIQNQATADLYTTISENKPLNTKVYVQNMPQ